VRALGQVGFCAALLAAAPAVAQAPAGNQNGAPISLLPPATLPLTGQELIPLVQNGQTDQTALANVLAVLQASSVIRFTPPPPVWNSFTGTYAGVSSNVGNLPSSVYTTTVPTAASLAGFIDIPSSETRFGFSGAIYGVARTKSTLTPAIGGLFVGTGGAPGTSAWSVNGLCSNTSSFNAASQTGISNVSCWGAEFDINMMELPGGGNPGGTARGLLVGGNSEVVPTGGLYGIEIESASAFLAPNSVAWTAALVIDDAPNSFGILLGPKGASGSSLGSQAIGFNSVNSSASALQSSIFTDINGDFVLYAPTTASTIFQDAGVNELWVQPGQTYQYSSSGSLFSTYATDSSGNTVIRTGAAGGALSIQNSATTVLASIGNPSPGSATKYVCSDSSGNWFSQSGAC
jgi:hypothetical protein